MQERSLQQAADAIGVDRKKTMRWLDRLGTSTLAGSDKRERLIQVEDFTALQAYSALPKRDRSLKVGETQHQAVLTEDLILAIKASDEPLMVLSRQLGIEPDTISKVRKGENWSHVGGEATPQRKIVTSERKPVKLMAEDVIDIVTSPMCASDMANHYNISQEYVRRLRRGLSWQDVTLQYVQLGGPSW